MVLQRKFDNPLIIKIEKVIDETPTVRTLVFSNEILSNVLPGQFAMVWIPGINELPMSVMISQEKGKAAFTVRKHGIASTGLFSLKVGEQIGVRGPYGNSFTLKQGNLLLVGGGTGLVPLIRLLTFLKKSDDVTLIMGSKTKDEVFFEKIANQILEHNKHAVIAVTEDGSYGRSGLVTPSMEGLLYNKELDAVNVRTPKQSKRRTNRVRMAFSLSGYVECALRYAKLRTLTTHIAGNCSDQFGRRGGQGSKMPPRRHRAES